MSKERVSVITPILNGAEFLRESVRSVQEQRWEDWELILVDDGSTDESPELAQALGREDRRIRWLAPDPERRGASAARNRGLEAASGQFVAFLDADDRFLPAKLDEQLAILRRCPDAGLVYGNTLYWYSWSQAGRSDRRPRLKIPADRLYPPPRLLSLYLRRQTAIPCTCSLLVRRQALQQIGGFEESFRYLYTDQVLYAKLCLRWPVFVASGCWDMYRRHPASSCSRAARSGHVRRFERQYLDWLETYLHRNGIRDSQIHGALGAARRRLNHPRLEAFFRLSRRTATALWARPLRAAWTSLPPSLRRRLKQSLPAG